MPKEERCKFTFRVALDLGQKCVCGYLSAPTNGERFTWAVNCFGNEGKLSFELMKNKRPIKMNCSLLFGALFQFFVIDQTKLLLLYGTIPPGKRSSRWWGSPSRRWWCCCFPPSPAGRYFGGTCSSPLRGMSLVVKKFTLTSTSLTSHRTATM